MIFICYEEQAEWMSDYANCEYEEAIEFLEIQQDYYDEIGLNVYPWEEDFGVSIRSDIVVKEDDMAKYIDIHSSLSIETIDELLVADVEYLKFVGVIQKEEYKGGLS
ncbi:MAG: hypothetical protein K6G75_07785 [Lachnospiraceae bacterium]|nr:hypothetical protein [Lachnospiraceae bacterium]